MMSKKQFVVYMTVAFGLAWILEIIASIMLNDPPKMVHRSTKLYPLPANQRALLL